MLNDRLRFANDRNFSDCGATATASLGNICTKFVKKLTQLSSLSLFALIVANPAHAQEFVFSGTNTGGDVDYNGDGTPDGTWTITNTGPPIQTASFPAQGGVAFFFDRNGGGSYDLNSVFDVTLSDPEITFQLTLFGSLGTGQSFASAFNDYTLSWTGGTGNAIVNDPDTEIGSVTNGVNSVNFTQTPTSSGTNCNSAVAIRNNCIDWFVILPNGSSDLELDALAGRRQEGFRFSLVSFTDLQVSKSPSAPTLSEGDSGSFDITVSNMGNPGDSAAVGTQLTDLLPSGLTYTGHSISSTGANAGGSYSSSTGLWDVGKVSLGETITLTINFTVDAGTAGSTITNSIDAASIRMAQTDTVPNNDVLNAAITIASTPVVATNDSASGVNGVTGESGVLNVFTDDTVGGNAAGTGNATLAVAGGSSVPAELSFDITTGDVSVNPNTPAGTYSFDYEICESGNSSNCQTATASITVAPSVDLSITKTNTPGVNGEVDQVSDTVTSGSTTTYTLTVNNNGPDNVTGAIVTDTPGSGITCAATNSVTITGNGVPAGSFTVADLTGAGITLDTLNNGQSATLNYSCEIN